jgi:putative transposase
MKQRNKYSPEFKTEVVVEVLREEDTLNEIAARHSINPVMLSRWKTEFLERAAGVFKKGPSEAEKELEEERRHVEELERKVGQLTDEVDWMKKKMPRSELFDATEARGLVDQDNPRITVKRQCELLGFNRTSVYRVSAFRLIHNVELRIRGLIDRIHTDEPTWGHRTITTILKRDYGIPINKKRTRRIMRQMGIYTLFPQPNLSKRYHSQFLKPYLLRHMKIQRVNQVWLEFDSLK